MASSGNPTNSFSAEFGAAEREEASRLIEWALEEDLPEGDVTSAALFAAGDASIGVRMEFVSRQDGVLCGLPVVELTFSRIDSRVRLVPLRTEGARIRAGVVAEITGPLSSVLAGERTALNLLTHLSGIASTTSRWVETLRGLDTVLLDTRKTTPGWRRLEKYAVRVGGATNHRAHLSDGFLLKDNHARVLRATGRTRIGDWVECMRRRAPDKLVEVEVDTREEFLEARDSGLDVVLLDNFSLDDLRWAVEKNRSLPGKRPLLEASGGVRLDTLKQVAETGVDRISAGSLTHSFQALDISLEMAGIDGPPGSSKGKETST